VAPFRPPQQIVEDGLMPAVHAIEGSDGDDGGVIPLNVVPSNLSLHEVAL
jgi:hypothetical protein